MKGRIADYTVANELARGSNGVVVRARSSTGEQVAIKVLLAQRQAEPEDLERFRREAEIASRLDHPHIVRLLDSGDSEHGPFQVVELVEGQDLQKRVESEGPLDPVDAARIAHDLARALEHAHNAGVVHRDLKPANVLLDAEGRARLTDFGLGRLIDPFTDRLTLSGDLLGTPVFMAPEQAHGSRIDIGPHTDIFALGGTLYYLLTGVAPASGSTLTEVLLSVVQTAPVPLTELRPDVDERLAAICHRCLAKKPAGRYLSAAAVANDLRDYLAALEPRPSSLRPAWFLLAAAPLALLLLVWVLASSDAPSSSPARAVAHAPRAAPLPETKPPSPRTDPLRPILAEIDEALRKRDPARAQAALQKASATHDDDARLHLRAFRLREATSDRPGALAALARARRLGATHQVTSALEALYPHPGERRLAQATFLDPQGLEEAVFRCSQLLLNPTLDVEAALARLDAIALRLRPQLEGLSGRRRFDALVAEVQRSVMRGTRQNHYSNIATSQLERCLEERTGIHITCGIALIALGRRLEIPIDGVCFPIWFQVRLNSDPPVYLDPLKGEAFGPQDLRERFQNLPNKIQRTRIRTFHPAMGAPSSTPQVVLRYLLHLRVKLTELHRPRAASRAKSLAKMLFPYDLAAQERRASGDRR